MRTHGPGERSLHIGGSVRLRELGRCIPDGAESEVRTKVVVREAQENGRTWWEEWTIGARRDVLAMVVAHEVTSRRRRYEEMLADNICRTE